MSDGNSQEYSPYSHETNSGLQFSDQGNFDTSRFFPPSGFQDQNYNNIDTENNSNDTSWYQSYILGSLIGPSENQMEELIPEDKKGMNINRQQFLF